jgi:B12-binding domain/radical SAM domain protein
VPTPTLVLLPSRSGVAALNVVAAALLSASDTATMPVVFARDLDEVIRVARAAPAAVVGASFYSTDAPTAYAAVARVREEAPAALRIAGGVHASARPAEVLDAGFDAVAVGEGEATILALMRAVRDGAPLDTVPGLVRHVAGHRVHGPPSERHPLDSFPAFHAPARRFNPIEITRGCVYACAFCQTPYVFKARFRHRSVADVAAHVETMVAGGLNYVRFVTPTCLSYGSADTAVDLGAVEALLRAVRGAMGAGKVYFGTFPSECRPEHVTPEAMALLRTWVDNRGIIIGGQSGSDRVLEATRRGHTVADVVRAVEVARAAGFVPDVDLILGLPGETRSDQDATVALAERVVRMGGRVHTHAFLPLPGTPLQGAIPSPVAPEAAAAIMRLESQGAAYGQWRRQLDDGARLARAAGSAP